MSDGLRHAGAGALATGAALAASELVAGWSEPVPSLVESVGDWVIDTVPAPIKDWAISVFGTYDKPVLIVGIVVVALGIGGLVGWSWRRRLAPAAAVFGAFAVLATAAALASGAEPVPTIVGAAVAVIVGVAVLAWLRSRLPSPGDEAAGFDPTRRAFLRGAAAVIVVSALSVGAGRAVFERNRAMVTRRQTVTLPPAVEPVAAPPPATSFPVLEVTPIVTPNSEFYRIDTALSVPAVDTESWSLRILGLVEAPYELTYDELLAMDLVERYITLSCVSNQVGGDLVGTARWLGVPLSQVLDRAGVHAEATQIVGRSVDGFTVGFPTEAAFDGREALVAVGMNGEPLPLEHGFPARLVVAGLYGYVSATKWLSDIELTRWEDFDAYWVPRGWAKEGPIKTQSRIDVPRPGAVGLEEISIAGVAWAPNVGIERVEVQVDGEEWTEAELAEPLNDDTWRQWRLRWTPTAGDHQIRVRATDRSGYTQTEERMPPAPDGATGWHTIRVTAA